MFICASVTWMSRAKMAEQRRIFLWAQGNNVAQYGCTLAPPGEYSWTISCYDYVARLMIWCWFFLSHSSAPSGKYCWTVRAVTAWLGGWDDAGAFARDLSVLAGPCDRRGKRGGDAPAGTLHRAAAALPRVADAPGRSAIALPASAAETDGDTEPERGTFAGPAARQHQQHPAAYDRGPKSGVLVVRVYSNQLTGGQHFTIKSLVIIVVCQYSD